MLSIKSSAVVASAARTLKNTLVNSVASYTPDSVPHIDRPIEREIRTSKLYEEHFHAESLHLPVARYGGRQTVTLLPGYGVGPELFEHVKDIFNECRIPVVFEDVTDYQSNVGTVEAEDENMEKIVASVRRNGVALKGSIDLKFSPDRPMSRNVELRRRLDLYAAVARFKSVPTIPCKHNDIDIILIRENTEGEYSGIEHEAVKGIVESYKICTRYKAERIARFAFNYARKHNRKKVTAIHKANIMKLGDGMFLSVCGEVAKEYPDLKFENMIVDNTTMQLVSRPQQFDVMVMPNLYGNIISNICAGLIGGAGLPACAMLGERYAVFEAAARNAAYSLVGKNKANPAATLRAAIIMLQYLGLTETSQLLHRALKAVLIDQCIHTPDVGGNATTTEFTEAIIAECKKLTKEREAWRGLSVEEVA